MSTISNISITENQLIINYKGPPPPQRYRGVNLSAYDEGSMAGKPDGKALCTDNSNDVGGWVSFPTVPEDINTSLDQLNLPAKFSVGGKQYYNNKGSIYKGSPLLPIINDPFDPQSASSKDSIWTTSYPQLHQIKTAIKNGVNIFRLPFMPTFIYDLATGWAKERMLSDRNNENENFLYAQANPEYFNYYMTTLNAIVSEGAYVIMDNHVYQRWCPMNIPGTYSCLEPSGPGEPNVPSRKYSMDKTTDMGCPYVLDQKGLRYFNSKGIKSEWEEGTMDYIKGNEKEYTDITKENINNYLCTYATNLFSSSTKAIKKNFNEGSNGLCQSSNKGGPNGNACYGGPTKRILGVDCTTILWYNILNLKFQLITNENGGRDKAQTVKDYLKKNSKVWLGLMNEPNEVNTRVLGKTYGKVINMIRGLGVTNTLLVEGNYWAGLHAQIDPNGAKAEGVSRPDSTGEGWTWPEDEVKPNTNMGKGNWGNAPAEIIYQEILKANGNNMKSVGDWKYDVHQYLDKNSTGNVGCTGDSDSGVKDIKGMRFFSNMDKFEEWCKDRNVRAFCSEFGAQNGNKAIYKGGIDPGCKYKLNLFMQMLEESPAFDGWTIWRNPPAVSFAVPYGVTPGSTAVGCDQNPPKGQKKCTNSISWTNSVMWQPLEENIKSIAYKNDPHYKAAPFAEKGPKGNYYYYMYKNLYQCTKAFTDPKSQEYCMPYLWALNGDSTKSADGQKALQKCIKYGTKEHELEVEEEGYY